MHLSENYMFRPTHLEQIFVSFESILENTIDCVSLNELLGYSIRFNLKRFCGNAARQLVAVSMPRVLF